MKKIILTTIALAAIAACQVTENESPAPVKMKTVKAVLSEEDPLSRVNLSEGQTEFKWNENDKLVAWDGSAATTNCAMTSLEGGIATFEVPENTQWVIYPSAALTVSGNTATWTRPTNQVLSADGQAIGDGAAPMFGKLEGDILKFTHLCGFIRFQLTGAKTLSKLSFKSNTSNSIALTGKASIDVNASTPVITYPVMSTVSSGTGQFAYTNVQGQEIPLGRTSKGIIVAVPPATYKDSELILEFTDGTAAAVISKNDIVVERGKVKTLKDINVDSLFPRDPVALDKGGRSNCYMVIASDEPQAYSFHAQKILGDTFDLAKTANLVWSESKTLVNNITFDKNTNLVTFLYGGKNEEGNALIAIDQNLQGAATTLLWNFHIWVTDQPNDILIDETDQPQPLMDRNVGSTWAPQTIEDIQNMTAGQLLESTGTYYQYGNHIPYPRMAKFENTTAAFTSHRIALQYGFSNYCHRMVTSAGAKATLAEQEQFPNYQYHKGTSVTYTFTDPSGKTITTGNETIWTTVKLKGGVTGELQDIWKTSNSATEKENDYDPCPQGYVMPTATHIYQSARTTWGYKALGDVSFAGIYYTDASENLLWNPAAGYLGSGKYSLVGSRVVYWAYFVDSRYNMDNLFRRCLINGSGATASTAGNYNYTFDVQPFSSQGHNLRCRRLVVEE